MGMREMVLFYYGVRMEPEGWTFDELGHDADDVRGFLEKLRSAPPLKALFSGLENEYPRCSGYVSYYDVVKKLDQRWKRHDDPVSIGYEKLYEEIIALFLSIRAVRFRQFWGQFRETFTLPGAPTAVWDQLLRAKCEAYDIAWEERTQSYSDPAFHVFRYGLEGAECALFCYGMILKDHDACRVIDDSEASWELDPEWAQARDPLFVNILQYGDDKVFVLGVRETKFDTSENERPRTLSFDLPFVETAAWDRLLRAKCEAYGVTWRDPKFHLLAETWV